MENSCLHTHNLAIGYSEKNQYNCLANTGNITLQKGELIALIGQNGVGKSTLLRTLCGLQKPVCGTFSIQNKDIQAYNGPLVSVVVATWLLPNTKTTVRIRFRLQHNFADDTFHQGAQFRVRALFHWLSWISNSGTPLSKHCNRRSAQTSLD